MPVLSKDASLMRRVDSFLFVVCFFTYGYFYHGGFSNPNIRLDYGLALVFDGVINVDSYAFNSLDKAKVLSHYYLDKAPGLSYLLLPLLFVFKILDPWVGWLASGFKSNFLQYLATLWAVSLPSAWVSTLFRKLLLHFSPSLSLNVQILITLITFLATLCLPYSTIMFSHQLALVFLLSGYYFGLSANAFSYRKILSFFLLASAVLVEYTVAILSIGIFFSLCLHHKWRLRNVKELWVIFVPLAILLLHNYLLYGAFWLIGYANYQGTIFYEGLSQGFFGVQAPSLAVIVELLFKPYRGLFVYCPILLAAILGFFYAPRQLICEYTPILLASVVLLLAMSGYAFWQGGTSFGPRHLLPVIPFLMLGLAFLPRKIWRNPVLILFIFVSFAINWIGTITTPFVHELARRPLFVEYPILLLQAKIAINPMGFLTPHEVVGLRWRNLENYPSQAFNLGTLLGLEGYSSLLPLLVFWLSAVIFYYYHFAKRLTVTDAK